MRKLINTSVLSTPEVARRVSLALRYWERDMAAAFGPIVGKIVVTNREVRMINAEGEGHGVRFEAMGNRGFRF